MSKVGDCRKTLNALSDWDAFLGAESSLPGPRGNLELARAVADEGELPLFQRYLALDADQAPTNSPQEFLAFCGVLGLGRLLAEGQLQWMERLRERASDPRWRIREAVAMALQRLGAVDTDCLIEQLESWVQGSPLEQRAAAAGLCEPGLLQDNHHARRVLDFLDHITACVAASQDRKREDFKALRKGLAYCWRVAVAASPECGQPLMEKWFASQDKHVSLLMKQNLKKRRLARVAPEWVEQWQQEL